MMKFATLLAAAALAAPALADPAPRTIRFERDGVGYVADIRYQGGVELITGRQLNGAQQPFTLRVAKGQVTGTVGSIPVAYAVPAAKRVETALK